MIVIDKSKLNSTLIESFNKEKGLAILGEVGVGKTTFMLEQYLPTYRKAVWDSSAPEGKQYEESIPMAYHHVSASTIKMEVAKFGVGVLDNYTNGMLYIEDLGMETEVNSFGTIINPIEYLIDIRYKDRKYYRTHFCTNLQPKQLEARYARTWSRLKEMCNIVIVTGTDYRDEK